MASVLEARASDATCGRRDLHCAPGQASSPRVVRDRARRARRARRPERLRQDRRLLETLLGSANRQRKATAWHGVERLLLAARGGARRARHRSSTLRCRDRPQAAPRRRTARTLLFSGWDDARTGAVLSAESATVALAIAAPMVRTSSVLDEPRPPRPRVARSARSCTRSVPGDGAPRFARSRAARCRRDRDARRSKTMRSRRTPAGGRHARAQERPGRPTRPRGEA